MISISVGVYMIDRPTLQNLHTSCPSQWQGRDHTGQYVYIRYRYGSFEVYSPHDELIYEQDYGGPWDGVMNDEEMLSLLDEAGL